MQENIDNLLTEQNNPFTLQIDQCDTRQMLEMINREDQTVAFAVANELDSIAQAVDGIVCQMLHGGRLIYIGAGTSGRLGVLDASECIPTYGTSPEQVVGVIAGGSTALVEPVEGAEDNVQMALDDLAKLNITSKDAIVGITASGRTPYVLAALHEANVIGAFTVGICNTKHSELSKVADIALEIATGPEVVMGSTRMKAGTAQKMVLNMLSTCTMIKLGKVYSNYMVDLNASNQKLQARSLRMIRLLTDVEQQVAQQALKQADGNLKVAILMLKGGVSAQEAVKKLNSTDGVLRTALESL